MDAFITCRMVLGRLSKEILLRKICILYRRRKCVCLILVKNVYGKGMFLKDHKLIKNIRNKTESYFFLVINMIKKKKIANIVCIV